MGAAAVDEDPPPERAIHQSAFGRDNIQAVNSVVSVYRSAPAAPVDPVTLAAARALFAELPLDRLPEPAGLPPGSVMPWQRNRFFTGREPDLLALARHLKEGGSAAVGQSLAVTGLGGQGKTQLAVEFAYRYGSWFPGGVFFVNCADPGAIAESVAACALVLANDPGVSARPLPERVALVAAAWAGPLPRLLIFDNCEDVRLLEDWAPRGDGCRLLLTARRATWPAARGIIVRPLGRLSRAESLTLLRRHRPDCPPDDPGLDGIADMLGDLPLALELAGSYLKRYRHEAFGTPAAYLAELSGPDLLAHASLTIADPNTAEAPRTMTGHEACVARTFAVSLRRLKPEDPTDALARDLLACAAWLAPGLPIPLPLLRSCAGRTEDNPEAARRFADAVERLGDLALAERPEETRGAIVLHRLVAAFARGRLDENGSVRDQVEGALAALANHFLPHHDPTPFRGWAEHLLAAAAAAGRDGTSAAISLLQCAGSYSRIVADYGLALTMLEDAATRAEAAYGPDHPEVASTLTNLGIVQQYGNLEGALHSLTRALRIKETAYRPDHSEVARTLVNLGTAQKRLGRRQQARECYERALVIFSARLGDAHPHTLQARRLIAALDGANAEKRPWWKRLWRR